MQHNLEKAGVSIFSNQLKWSFAHSLADYTPIFLAELLAIIVAFRKLCPQKSKVILATGTLSVCAHWTFNNPSHLLSIFSSVAPGNLSEVRFVWVPGHSGIFLNKSADSLASSSLYSLVLNVLPDFYFITGARLNAFYCWIVMDHPYFPQMIFGI